MRFQISFMTRPLTYVLSMESQSLLLNSEKKKRSFNVIICLNCKLPTFEQLIHKHSVVLSKRKEKNCIRFCKCSM